MGVIPSLLFAETQSSVESQENIAAKKEIRCDLNLDGICDDRDVQLVGSWVYHQTGVIAGSHAVAARADADRDGFITLHDMRQLFPQADFPDLIAWLDLYDKAEQAYSHGWTLADTGKEAALLRSQGLTQWEVNEKMTKANDAASLYSATVQAKEVFKFAESHFGPYDFEVLETINFLGALYSLQRMDAQTQVMTQREFDILRHNEGVDSAMDFARRKWMGRYLDWISVSPERYQEAERLFQDIIAWEDQQNHRTAHSSMDMAELCYVQGKYDQAAQWFQEGFQLLKENTMHPSRIVSWMEHDANALQKIGKSGEATQLRERAARLREKGLR